MMILFVKLTKGIGHKFYQLMKSSPIYTINSHSIMIILSIHIIQFKTQSKVNMFLCICFIICFIIWLRACRSVLIYDFISPQVVLLGAVVVVIVR